MTEGPLIAASVFRINPAGSLAKIVLVAAETQRQIHVDLPFERFFALNLKTGENVYVSPKRVRAFVPDDYMI